MVARLDVETQQFIGLLGEFMTVSKDQITRIAALMACAERFGLLPTRRCKIAFIYLRCGNINSAQAEAILKYINR